MTGDVAVTWHPLGTEADGTGWQFTDAHGEPWIPPLALEAEARPYCSNPEDSHDHDEPCSECKRIAAAIQTAVARRGMKARILRWRLGPLRYLDAPKEAVREMATLSNYRCELSGLALGRFFVGTWDRRLKP